MIRAMVPNQHRDPVADQTPLHASFDHDVLNPTDHRVCCAIVDPNHIEGNHLA